MRAALVLVGCAIVASALQAQTLRPNQRVRLWTGTNDPLTGYLVRYDPQVLHVVPVGEVRPVPFLLSDLNTFEVSIGPSWVVQFGTVLSGITLGIWLGASGQFESSRCRAVGAADPECAWMTSPALIGAGGGFIVSALAARLLVPERWRAVRFWF